MKTIWTTVIAFVCLMPVSALAFQADPGPGWPISTGKTWNAQTLGIQAALNAAQSGDTVLFPDGNYSEPVGTTYFVTKNITLAGAADGGAILTNIRFIIIAPSTTIKQLTLNENDCYSDEQNLQNCVPSTPMITVGLVGYPIKSATLTNLNLNFTRAYTGIVLSSDNASNVLISQIQITDGDMSGITINQGNGISLSNISITGSSTTWVDDGIALTSYFGPLNNVFITGIQAQYTADLLGFGAAMNYPISNILVTNSSCTHVWFCLYNKASLGGQGKSNQAGIDNFIVQSLKSQ